MKRTSIKDSLISNLLILIIFFISTFTHQTKAQDVQVTTIIPDINASGGMARDAEGNFYLSDFGPGTSVDSNTTVYKIDKTDLSVSVFCDGFIGASGCCFDSQGNFYQANNNGNRISKIHPDGTKEYDWATEGLSLPIGVIPDSEDNIFVCNCSGNNISKITPDGTSSTFAESALFKCPNGLTIDPDNNLYACNFSDGNVLKITPDGTVSVFAEMQTLTGGPNPVGNGHLTYSNGYLYIALIGIGQIERICLDGQNEYISGGNGFSNMDGAAADASFSKPNGIIASVTGDTLFTNSSFATWTGPPGFHSNILRMITGINSLPTDSCDFVLPVTDFKPIEGLKFFEINPNPAGDKSISIQYEIEEINSLQFSLYDSSGHILQSQISPNTGQFKMNFPNLTPGIYIVKLQTDKGAIARKVVVQ